MKQFITHSIVLVFLLFSFGVQAQRVSMKGRVIETQTGEGIPYTNIGVQGTYAGVATDDKGYFTLDIPEAYVQKTVAVSAIGYRNKVFTANELLAQDFVRISLDKETYSFDAVDVTGQSLVAFRVLSNAIAQITANYAVLPFSANYHYLGKVQVGDAEPRIREAVVEMSDRTAYATPEVEDAYRNRNYKFTQVNKNFNSYSFPDGLARFDELLSLDVVRMGSSVFNTGLVGSFDLRIDGIMPYEGDSVWVISYKKDKPTVAHTGDFYAEDIAGKLYILKGNNALVRHEVHIEASKNNPTDRSLFTAGSAQTDVSYQAICIYQPFEGKYIMSYMSEDKQYVDASGNKAVQQVKASLLDLQQGAKAINNRDYYEDTAFDKAYWQKFRTKQ